MHLAPEPMPGDAHAPPSVDDVAAEFVGPLCGMVEQAALEEVAASTVAHTASGR